MKIRLALSICAMAGLFACGIARTAVAAEWLVPLSYEAVPAHVTMTVSGSNYGTFTTNVVGSARGGQIVQLADQNGWSIVMTADKGYAVPTFKVCPKHNDGSVDKAAGVTYTTGSADVRYDFGDAVHVYDISTEAIVEPDPGPLPGPEPEPVLSTLVFDADYVGAPDYSNVTVTVGQPYGTLPVPVRAHHTFGGWFLEGGSNRVVETTFARTEGRRTVTAKWTADTFWLAFDGQGGSGAMAPVELTYDAMLKLSNAFTRVGYTFDKWVQQMKAGPYEYAVGANVSTTSLADGCGKGDTVVLKATWKEVPVAPTAHAVGFDRTGWDFAETVPDFAVTNGLAWPVLPTPTNAVPERPFLGWTLHKDGFVLPVDLASAVPETLSAGDLTLVPTWGETPIAVALDSTGVVYTNDVENTDDAGFSIAPSAGADGGACLTGTIANSTTNGFQYVTLKGTVTGSGRLSFLWKIRSQRICDNYGQTNAWIATSEKFNFYTNGMNYACGIACGRPVNFEGGDDGAPKWLSVTSLEGDGLVETDGEMDWQPVSVDIVADPGQKTDCTWQFLNANYEDKTWEIGTVYLDKVTWNGEVVTNVLSYVAEDAEGTMADRPVPETETVTLDTNAFTKDGYGFAGWATSPTGAVQFADGAEVSLYADASAYAVWTNALAVAYTVRFDANGGTGTMAEQEVLFGEAAYLMPNAFVREGYDFAGWAKGADATSADHANVASVTDLAVRPATAVTLYAVWTEHVCGAGEERTVPVDLGGTETNVSAVVGQPWDAALPAPPAPPAGKAFGGWYTGVDGTGTAVTAETVVSADLTGLYPKWVDGSYTVHFAANGGTGAMSDQKIVCGQTVALRANAFARKGWDFAGWSRTAEGAVAFADGAEVKDLDTADGAVVTLYAVWTEIPGPVLPTRLYETVAPALVEAGGVYDGRLLDAEGRLAGLVQVKLAKYNAKKDLAKITATVTPLGEKKLSYKGGEWHAGSTSATLVSTRDARVLEVVLGEDGLSGTFGDLAVDGARNVFTAKDAAAKAEAAAVLAKVQGCFTAACPSDEGWTALSVTVKTKGKVAVQGTLADGTKVSSSGQLLVGETVCCVPVAWAKKSAMVALDLWIAKEDGTAIGCGGADEGVCARLDASLAAGSVFRLDPAALAALLPGEADSELTPNGVPVAFNGRKWIVADGARAGSEANPCSLKLSLTAKNGLFKGSFKGLSTVAGRQKKTSVTVTGVQVGDRAYGSAVVKKVGSLPVLVAP